MLPIAEAPPVGIGLATLVGVAMAVAPVTVPGSGNGMPVATENIMAVLPGRLISRPTPLALPVV